MALYEALHRHPTPPSHHVRTLSPDVDLVLSLALAKDPGRRYPRAPELARDLAAAIEGRLASDVRERAEVGLASTLIGTAVD